MIAEIEPSLDQKIPNILFRARRHTRSMLVQDDSQYLRIATYMYSLFMIGHHSKTDDFDLHDYANDRVFTRNSKRVGNKKGDEKRNEI